MNGCLILCLLVATLSRGDFELEVRYAALLRERGLFRLSELQCQQLLGRSDLDRAAASLATIELSKSLAAHALNSHPPERGQLWQRATTVIDAALAVGADHPSRILLQTQKGLTVLLQAEWSRREAEVKARDDADWKLARDQLGSAISQLQEVANELDPAKRTGKSAEPLPPARRESLRRNVHHQLARAYRNHALTYADRSPDRVNSLTRALDHLKLLDASSGVDQLAWQSRLDRIGTFRLLKEFEKAKQLIVELQANELPAVFAASLATESVRLFLAAGRPDIAARLADDFAERSTRQARSNPEFELARIETLVARTQQAVEKQQLARPLEDRAISLATSLGERHGTYWGLRGRMLISRLAEQSAGHGNVELLKTAAESYMQRDLPEDAAETFIQAARQAEQEGNLAKAFEFRKRAAAVDHQRGNLRAAIDRLRDAALKHPKQPEAASTHLLGAFDAAKLYQQQVQSGTGPQRPARTLDQYRALLEEHLAHWPAAETADQARLWRGRLHEAEGNWEDALHDYQAIKPTSAQSVTRYDRLRGIYEKVLVGSDAETTVRLKEARQWLDAQAQSALAGEGNLQAARALLEAARLRLFHDPTDYPTADANLEEALSLIDRASSQAQELRALAVVSAAGRNQMQRALDEYAKAVPLPARPLVDILHGLQRVLDGRPNDGRIVDLMAKTAKLLTVYRDQLSETDRRLLAETEADTRQRSNLGDATKIYTQLTESHPQNARIQRRLAELLSLGKDRRARQAALMQWRTVVRKSRPYTQAWFRGKLGVATAHFDLNDRKHAQDMIELLMSLHPKMGGPELKRSFTSLLQRCRQ